LQELLGRIQVALAHLIPLPSVATVAIAHPAAGPGGLPVYQKW
jgi:hypothetical protein